MSYLLYQPVHNFDAIQIIEVVPVSGVGQLWMLEGQTQPYFRP
jgi:hypothetical protein